MLLSAQGNATKEGCAGAGEMMERRLADGELVARVEECAIKEE
jgi:hypothetical protein